MSIICLLQLLEWIITGKSNSLAIIICFIKYLLCSLKLFLVLSNSISLIATTLGLSAKSYNTSNFEIQYIMDECQQMNKFRI